MILHFFLKGSGKLENKIFILALEIFLRLLRFISFDSGEELTLDYFNNPSEEKNYIRDEDGIKCQ